MQKNKLLEFNPQLVFKLTPDNVAPCDAAEELPAIHYRHLRRCRMGLMHEHIGKLHSQVSDTMVTYVDDVTQTAGVLPRHRGSFFYLDLPAIYAASMCVTSHTYLNKMSRQLRKQHQPLHYGWMSRQSASGRPTARNTRNEKSVNR